MMYTFASDLAMSFELALKTLQQGLSGVRDDNPQITPTHDFNILLDYIYQTEPNIMVDIEHALTRYFIKLLDPKHPKMNLWFVGSNNDQPKLMSLREYFEYYRDVYDIGIRYAPNYDLDELQKLNLHFTAISPWRVSVLSNNPTGHYIGDDITLLYWSVIMKYAWRLRYEKPYEWWMNVTV